MKRLLLITMLLGGTLLSLAQGLPIPRSYHFTNGFLPPSWGQSSSTFREPWIFSNQDARQVYSTGNGMSYENLLGTAPLNTLSAINPVVEFDLLIRSGTGQCPPEVWIVESTDGSLWTGSVYIGGNGCNGTQTIPPNVMTRMQFPIQKSTTAYFGFRPDFDNGFGTVIIDNVSIFDKAAVGVDDPGPVVEFAPNPVQDQLRISGLNEGSYAVLNLNGERLLEGQLQSVNAIEMSGLAAGIYFVEVQDLFGARQALQKIVKQ